MIDLIKIEPQSDHNDTNSGTSPVIRAYVASLSRVTSDVTRYEFKPVDHGPLPEFTPGAHIDVHINEHCIRQYSLMNSPSKRTSYQIAVKHENEGRGGSKDLRERLEVGTHICISEPRNHFPLNEDAPFSIFIAGGIGITPLLSMCDYLDEESKPWHLHYAIRHKSQAQLLGRFQEDPRVTLYVQDEGASLNLEQTISQTSNETHLYCCGPQSLLNEFLCLTSEKNKELTHYEYFSAPQMEMKGAFEVVLSRSGKTLAVQDGETILEVVKRAGLKVVSSCEQGVCGACETKVLEGTPLHRDFLLTDKEKAAGKVMMICCSGSADKRIVLDL